MVWYVTCCTAVRVFYVIPRLLQRHCFNGSIVYLMMQTLPWPSVLDASFQSRTEKIENIWNIEIQISKTSKCGTCWTCRRDGWMDGWPWVCRVLLGGTVITEESLSYSYLSVVYQVPVVYRACFIPGTILMSTHSIRECYPHFWFSHEPKRGWYSGLVWYQVLLQVYTRCIPVGVLYLLPTINTVPGIFSS